jgi:hypothetical protein
MQHIFQVDSSKSSQSAIDLKTKYFFSPFARAYTHLNHILCRWQYSFFTVVFVWLVNERAAAKNNNNSNDRDDKEWRRKEERRKIMWNIIWIEISVFRIIYDINLNIFTLKALRFVDSWHHRVCVPFSKIHDSPRSVCCGSKYIKTKVSIEVKFIVLPIEHDSGCRSRSS